MQAVETSKQTPQIPARLLWLASILAAGFILIAHGCHGNEDTELLLVPSEASRGR